MKAFKINLFSYKFTLNNPVENNNDPMFKIVNSWEMIKEININYKEYNKKFIFFNKDIIHGLLYKEEESIIINETTNILLTNNNLSELFYLDLLITDNIECLNYTYSLDFIREINNNWAKKINNKLKLVIISKIVITLIYNFKGSDDYEEENKDELTEIENENFDIMKNNLEILKELNCNYGVNELKDAKIDQIFLDILISLIKQNKFDDIDYIENILTQLNLESINITEKMFKGISEELNVAKNEFLKEYMINDINDLKNEKIINFYYIIIIKVLKNSIYISQIEFLNKYRINLIKIIKNNKIMNLQLSSDLKNKIKSILKTTYNDYFYEKYFNFEKSEKKNEEKLIIVDSQYNENDHDKSDINKYSQSNINDELKEDKGLNDENGFLYEEKGELNETEDVQHNAKVPYEIAEKLLNYTTIKISIDKDENDGPQIKSEQFFYGKEKIEIQRKDLCENGKYEELTEDDKKNKDAAIVYKNYKYLLSFFKDIDDAILNSTIRFNPRIEIELKKQNYSTINSDSEHKEHKDLYDILCVSTFINQLDSNRVMEFVDRNILVNGLDGKCNGFSFLINELSNDDYENETFKYDD